MGYPALQGITFPQANINLQNTDLESILNPTFWTPTPFIAPSGSLNPLNPAIPLAVAKSVSPYIIGGIVVIIWLVTRKKR